MFTLHPAWRVRPRVMAVFFIVFIVIMAVLVIRDPWFGFLTPAGYLYAFAVLPWPWRLPGVAAVAVVAATAQTSGVDRASPFGIIVYAAVISVNVIPLCALAWMDWSNDTHAESGNRPSPRCARPTSGSRRRWPRTRACTSSC